MLRTSLFGAVMLGLMAAAVSAQDVDCGKAYKSALDKLKRETGSSPERLANMRRHALRVYDACQTGHLQDPKALFEKLDRSRN